MYCPYCGKEVHDQAVICVHCGKALTEKMKTASVHTVTSSFPTKAFEKLAKKLKTGFMFFLISGILSIMVEILYLIARNSGSPFVDYYETSMYRVYEVVSYIFALFQPVLNILGFVLIIVGLSAFIAELQKSNNR